MTKRREVDKAAIDQFEIEQPRTEVTTEPSSHGKPEYSQDTEGRITLPMPPTERAWLTELREGKHTKEEALQRAADLEQQLLHLADHADLPKRAPRTQIDRWLVETYQQWWEDRGYL